MNSVSFRLAASVGVACLLAGPCFAEPAFRLGVSGEADGNGEFVIESIKPGSSLRAIRDENGAIQSAERGDRVLQINQQPFSPELLRSMNQELLTTNGLADLTILDSRSGNSHQFTAVLRRADLNPNLGKEFRSIVKEEFSGVERRTVQIREQPNTVIGSNLNASFAPLDAATAPPLTVLAECQAGIDRLRESARKNQFEKMISAGTTQRAETILVNAYAAVSLDPNSELSASIAQNAQSAVAEEFRSSFQSFATEQGKKWREEKGGYYGGVEGIVFQPVTNPSELTVEVISSATVKLLLKANSATPMATIDQLGGWDPLPATNASLYGRYYYRVRDPASGNLRFGYSQDKYKKIVSEPPDGMILFP